jgi:hypothetical protein
MRRLSSVAFLALALSGCFKMTITSGRPPAETSDYQDRWRSAVIGNAIEIDKPVALDLICKDTGWAKIEQHESPLNWLADVFLAGFFYQSKTETVHCAAAGSAPPPPATTAPVPAQPTPTAPTAPPPPSPMPPAPTGAANEHAPTHARF